MRPFNLKKSGKIIEKSRSKEQDICTTRSTPSYASSYEPDSSYVYPEALLLKKVLPFLTLAPWKKLQISRRISEKIGSRFTFVRFAAEKCDLGLSLSLSPATKY